PAVRERALQMASALGRDPASLGLAGQAQAQPQAPAAAGATADQLAGPMAAAIAGKSPEEQKQFIQTMVAGLAERLKANPDDIEGWQRLARSYTVLGQPDKAREALASAAEHAQKAQAQTQTQAPAAAAPAAAGPTAGQLAGPMAAAIAGKSPEEQKQFIQTMVAGLA